METPLFIGRFQPFHKGHLDAVRQILKRHKKLIIGVGSSQYSGLAKNPYSSKLREKMITMSLSAAGIPSKKFVLVKIPDIHDDGRWVAHVEGLCPEFGEVWSGSKKVIELFRKDGKHAIVKPRFRRHVSGTLIRSRMRSGKSWRQLVPLQVFSLIKKIR